MPLYVTPLMVPVAPATALIRIPASSILLSNCVYTLEYTCAKKRGLIPFADFVTVESLKVTFSTVLSSRPPTEPMDNPWPPEQRPPENVIS